MVVWTKTWQRWQSTKMADNLKTCRADLYVNCMDVRSKELQTVQDKFAATGELIFSNHADGCKLPGAS